MSVGTPEVESLQGLEAQVRALAARVEALEKQPLRVPIATFGPEPFDLRKPIEAVIQSVGEEDYVASFFDANVNATGCNPNKAFANLVETLLTRLDTLERLPAEKLGKGPARQLAVLREFIGRRA